MKKKGESLTYKNAGVDIDLATSLLKKVKPKLARARRPEMLAPIGGFGGLFQIDLTKYKNPVMVSSIDGVGTKLMVAAMMQTCVMAPGIDENRKQIMHISMMNTQLTIRE